MKGWCYQHGLLSRLLWPLQMYEIAISRVERIQQYSNKYLRKWLGVPPCFSKVGLYTSSRNLQLPLSSLTEGFKIGKVPLHLMKHSANELIRKVYSGIKSGTKWSAFKAAQEAECCLRIKDIIGVTPTKRVRLSSTSNKVLSKVDPKGRKIYGERRGQDVSWGAKTATAVTQDKQCAWTKWNDIEPIKLSWKSLIAMEPLAISFHATELKLWRYTDLDMCWSCKSEQATLCHVLSAYPQSLQMYTWWHNKVREGVIELLRAQCVKICYSQGTHNTVSQGRWLSCEEKNNIMKLLNGACDWKDSVDLKTSLQFPVGGWWGQRIACAFTHCMTKNTDF